MRLSAEMIIMIGLRHLNEFIEIDAHFLLLNLSVFVFWRNLSTNHKIHSTRLISSIMLNRRMDLEQILSVRLLFRKNRKLPQIDLNSIIDDHDRAEAGHYYFNTDDSFTKERERILVVCRNPEVIWKKRIDGHRLIKTEDERWDNGFYESLLLLMIFICEWSEQTKEIRSLKYVNTRKGNGIFTLKTVKSR